MKRILLITTGALIGLSANATQQEAVGVRKAFTPVKNERAAESSVTKASVYKAPSRVATSDGKYELFSIITMPQVPFYMSGLTSATDGEFAPLPVPANTEVTYQGTTYASRASQSTPAFSDWDNIAYSWQYYNPETWLQNDVLTSEGKELSLTYTPDPYIGTLPLPTMTMKYEGESEDTKAPYKLVIGGQGILPLLNDNDEVEATEIGFNTTVMIEGMSWDQSTRRCAEAMFGTARYTDTNQTLTEGTAEWGMDRYADEFEDTYDQPLKEVQMKAIGYNLPYAGSPYLLKSASLACWSVFLNDVTFQVDFYEANVDGYPQGSPIYSSNVVVPKTKNEPGYMYMSEITTNFISEDEDGFELDYIVVDKPLVAIISGFIDNENVSQFSPWSMGYDQDANEYVNGIPHTAFTVMDLIGENGAKVSNHQNYFNLWRFSNDGVNYYSYRSYYVTIEAEYPYLQPATLFVDGNDGQPIDYKADGNYTIQIPDDAEELAIAIVTSADNSDEIVFDDEDLPEWLEMEAIDAIGYVNPQGSLMNFIEVHFFLTGDFKDKTATIPFIYKNLTANIILHNGEDSGVDAIVAPENGPASYYDLQGRKLNNAPEKGIYILKEGNKVSKVIR